MNFTEMANTHLHVSVDFDLFSGSKCIIICERTCEYTCIGRPHSFKHNHISFNMKLANKFHENGIKILCYIQELEKGLQ